MNLRRTSAAGVATVALAATAAFAAGSLHTERAAASTGGNVTVVEHAVTDTTIHTAGPGDRAGNTLVFHNRVYDATNRRVVGHDSGFCTRIYPAAGSWECLWTTFLRGGQLTVQGPYYDTRNSVLSVTGGTGVYEGARGQMPLIARDHGLQYDFVFQLTTS